VGTAASAIRRAKRGNRSTCVLAFVEGLVPLATLIDDRYTYHENTREIIGLHSRKTYRIGDRLRVLVDRIDPVEKKINFAVLEVTRPKPPKRRRR